MKKVAALILVLVLLGSFAMAESFDFTNMSDEELVKLAYEVTEEIADRGIEKTATLIKGVYVVGVDIPEGSYYFKGDDDENAHGIFSLQPNVEDPNLAYLDKRTIYDSAAMDENSEYYATLIEGDVLTIPYQFKATISAGIKFE